MKFDIDCAREILIAVESCEFGKTLSLDELHESLPNYDKDTLAYHCLKLEEGEMLTLQTILMPLSPLPMLKSIDDITYAGHQFLASVRSDTIWKDVKSVLTKLGVSSLSVATQVAGNVLSQLVRGVIF